MIRTLRILGALIAATALLAAPAFAGEGGKPKKKRVTDAEEFMEIPYLAATISDDGRVAGLLQVEAGLDIPDARLRRKAEALMPRLRDAYTDALTAYAGRLYRPGDAPDADRIAALLQSATDRVLEEEGAHVLLGMVMVHDP